MATSIDPALRASLTEALARTREAIRLHEDELAELRRQEEALAVLVAPGRRGEGLGGDALRAAAHELLRQIDPEQRGVHYRDICQGLLDAGYLINGQDQAGNLRASIGHGTKAAALFRPMGEGDGRYTWR